jgi:predicted glutamine amidotransferase
MNIEEEIVYLSKLWYRYVGLDHHKDRDCHFYVEKRWSYGDKPYYVAYHNGYVASDFEGTKCDTLEEAQEELRDFMYLNIHKEYEWLTRVMKKINSGDDDWSEEDREERQAGLDVLSGWNDYRKNSKKWDGNGRDYTR